jgi:anti-sigma regulatory factor (Ser/Thr protein kinase)
MSCKASEDILLTGFDEADISALREALGALGRTSVSGDPAHDTSPGMVLAAARDEAALRRLRSAALDDPRPWCFCVPASDRGLVAAAVAAREGHMLLLPPDGRELRRLFVALTEEAKQRGAGDAAFSGLDRLDAEFCWKTSALQIGPVCRRLARLLAESGFYADRSGEDECALALEEALVNSVEHGNLGLDSSLRPNDTLGEDRYEAERVSRMADPRYGDKLIRLRVSMRGGEAKIVLEDEGLGFDTTKLTEGPSGLEVSGKGFWLIKRPFDAAVYNEKGNSLTLTRRRDWRGRS